MIYENKGGERTLRLLSNIYDILEMLARYYRPRAIDPPTQIPDLFRGVVLNARDRKSVV